ncbi:unnamed protein product [Spirodela intermedia]|uniref:Uncharacterized protein n=2 Tax=Spirodela intermedia TaxID=51605 RepID=A0A7I8LIC8_SPIIN|nr:unnamed protein product [Spirodela intermedia]CAA6672580.1 unnamed protein product [Spirodela intermedia]CAA7409789.1 unnamed protein product [Spirodela intermedia]
MRYKCSGSKKSRCWRKEGKLILKICDCQKSVRL